jgi:four helix bundle protein
LLPFVGFIFDDSQLTIIKGEHMKNFRTLGLATEFYEKAQKLKVKGHLRDQLLRGSSSVALNLSEGNAKFSVDEKKRFYQMAYASQKESQTTLKLLAVKDHEIIQTLDHLGACIYKLLKSNVKSLDTSGREKGALNTD